MTYAPRSGRLASLGTERPVLRSGEQPLGPRPRYMPKRSARTATHMTVRNRQYWYSIWSEPD